MPPARASCAPSTQPAIACGMRIGGVPLCRNQYSAANARSARPRPMPPTATQAQAAEGRATWGRSAGRACMADLRGAGLVSSGARGLALARANRGGRNGAIPGARGAEAFMHLQLDGLGPLHAQLTRALKTALAGGRFGQGSRLPPTRALARDLGVSRNTVLTAYEQLRAEGFMAARVGSGSYVAAPLLVEAANDPPPVVAPPQTAYARRAREAQIPMLLRRKPRGAIR